MRDDSLFDEEFAIVELEPRDAAHRMRFALEAGAAAVVAAAAAAAARREAPPRWGGRVPSRPTAARPGPRP